MFRRGKREPWGKVESHRSPAEEKVRPHVVLDLSPEMHYALGLD